MSADRVARTSRLLIVDDEPELREMLKDVLEDVATQIDLAESAQRALDLIGEHSYDAILSDIQMPGMTGLELLERLRSRKITVPFVLITGFADKDKAVRALKSGAFDFLEKPFESNALRLSIAAALETGATLKAFDESIKGLVKGFPRAFNSFQNSESEKSDSKENKGRS